MKLFLLFLFSLIGADIYAACTNLPPTITLNITGTNVSNLPISSTLSPTASSQIVGNCTPNVYLRSEFTPNAALLSSNSPFNLNNTTFTISGSTGDANAISLAKTYLINNFKFSFSLKDNNTSATSAKSISNNSTIYNILPDTAPNTSNIYNYNGTPYYTGTTINGGSGSFGIKIPSFSYQLLSEKPSATVINALQGATITVTVGTLKTGYLNTPTTSTTPLIEQNTTINLSFILSFNLPTCAVNVPSTLDIGSTTVQALETNNISNNTPFQLDITCSTPIPNRTFKLIIEDAYDSSNINTLGRLTNQPNLINASNAVIQIMNAGVPFNIGSQFNYGNSGTSTTQTQFQFMPSAQLLKTTSPVTLGNVAGKARFLMDYE